MVCNLKTIVSLLTHSDLDAYYIGFYLLLFTLFTDCNSLFKTTYAPFIS